MTLLAKGRQEFLHTLNGITTLMLCRILLNLVISKINERLYHELGARTDGARQRVIVRDRKRETTSSHHLDSRCSIAPVLQYPSARKDRLAEVVARNLST